MTVFRVQKNSNYTVMSNEHLRNPGLSLKAKGLLSQMLSLPEDWDYSLEGLSRINKEGIDAIRTAIRELERFGYLERHRVRDELGKLTGTEYIVHEQAVAREIREELGVDLSTTWYLDTIEYDYPDFHLSMDVFVSELAPGEEPRLLEHREGRWLGRAELGDVDWLPADLSLIDRVGAMWDSIFQPSHL